MSLHFGGAFTRLPEQRSTATVVLRERDVDIYPQQSDHDSVGR